MKSLVLDKIRVFYLFCVFIVFLFVTYAHASIVSEVEVKGLSSIQKDELLYLLGIQVGENIDSDIVRKGIKRAFLKGIFDDISVSAEDGERVKVSILVKEKDSVRKISISGQHDVSTKKIREIFPIKEGQYLSCEPFERAIDELKKELSFLGFPHAEIAIKTVRLKSPYKVDIKLEVNTGIPEIIKRIDINGPEEIKSVMKLTAGSIFNRSILKKDLDRIRAYYKKKDYFKPLISEPIFKDGVLSFSVNPGKQLKINISGNSSISDRRLLRELPFSEAEDFNDDILQEALSRLLHIYYTEGYAFAQIAPVVSEKNNIINVNFFIFEGPLVEVGRISFSGNTIKENKLKEIMSLKEGKIYNSEILDSDRDALKDFYNALGYLDVYVEEIQAVYDGSNEKMDIYVTLNEGKKTLINEIQISGASSVLKNEIKDLINIKIGDAYNEVDIANARYRIIESYISKGFPDVKVEVKREIRNGSASLLFNINEGQLVLFGKTIVTGNQKTKFNVVRRELQQKENTPFDASLLSKERQKLYKLGLFSDIYMEPLDTYEGKKDVLIRLKEGNAGAIEVSLGYAEYEQYRGIIDLSYRNLMGMNREASLRLELSSLEKRYVLQYYEPWFMKKELPFRVFILGEDKREINIDTRETRYKLIRHSIAAGFEKKISKVLRGELYYDFSLVNTFDVKPDVVLSKEDTGTLIISGLRIGLVYDTRDNQFYPKKGIFSGVALKFTSPIFLSETNFAKLTVYGNIYHEIARGLVLAASLRGGVAQGYFDTNELPIVERFFLGGRTTVRGYDQDTLGPKGSDGNPIGGNVFLMENLELRASVSKNFGVVAFIDGGNVWVKTGDINIPDVKFTAGLGLRYNTPVGPVRIDYGRKLQRESGESAGEIHFSIGHAF
ncbi:MAG: outer membrane protein assembly factor BamA [Nitrospirae bacterium]|jgi:outer membrane protein insertion porin family|nr:outer membrane protein assembly factor BamA [Nitrospirota bacterium]